MRETERLAGLMRAGMAGSPWHGPSVLAAVEGLDATGAAARPVAGFHSVWQLAAHLAATQSVVLRRLAGEPAGMDEAEFWPALPEPTAENWQALLDTLRRQEEQLATAVSALPDGRLLDRLPKGEPAYTNLVGHLQHNAYHAGQIKLLRRLL